MKKNTQKEAYEQEKFDFFYKYLIEENQKYNLTTITDKDEVFEKHFQDSLSVCDFLHSNSKILDIGAGAGFPSIPIAITRSDLSFTLIDSTNKRINFINNLKKQLNLENVQAYHTRIEDFSTKYKEQFDYVIARAVAPLPTLLEYSATFLKIGGVLVAYKGANYEEELENSKNALDVLGLKLQKIEKYLLKNCNQTRFLLFFSKIKQTPKEYPRKLNKPRISPL